MTPRRAAFSVALGLFIGLLPLYGLHLLIIGALALPLRLDFFVAYIAANISIPPMIPLILFAQVQNGAWLVDGAFLPLAMDSLSSDNAMSLGVDLAVGALVVSSVAALVGGMLAWGITRAFQRARSA
jgi:uncharacterized protein (DUF2062 family)